jgi:TRAP-type transport system periplasmic protein
MKQNAMPVKPIELKMGTFLPPVVTQELYNMEWIKKVQKETNGRVQINLYSAQTLINAMTSWNQLLQGVADIAQCSVSFPGSSLVISNSLSAFVYGADLGSARKVYEELLKIFPEFRKEYAGAKQLYSSGGTATLIHSKKPIRTLDDFKGLKLASSPSYPELAEKLGATGVSLPIPEIYPALVKGIVEGVFSPGDQLKSLPGDPTGKLNYTDVTKYSTNLHIVTPPVVFYAVNQDSWNRLPQDIQKVFEDSIPWMNAKFDQLLLQTEQEGFDFAKAKGHEFIELSPEEMNKFYHIMEEIALPTTVKLDAQGIPGTKIFKETRSILKKLAK